jgi:DNA-binding Lrp family transcriptional regulator
MLTPDRTDVRLLRALVREPRLTVSELAERAGVARNTAQARLDRLHAAGVLGDNERGVALRPLGFSVNAVVVVQIEHRALDEVIVALERNANVLQVEETVGAGDLLVRVAARDTDDLQSVIHSLLDVPGVERTQTSVVLTARVPYRVTPLLQTLTEGGAA